MEKCYRWAAGCSQRVHCCPPCGHRFAQDSKFLTLETGDVMTKARMCRGCGLIEIVVTSTN